MFGLSLKPNGMAALRNIQGILHHTDFVHIDPARMFSSSKPLISINACSIPSFAIGERQSPNSKFVPGTITNQARGQLPKRALVRLSRVSGSRLMA
ncbi:MAG: hypothetical protein AAFQ14_14140 [Cyanobacteria bacterium J06621_12]